MAESMIADLLKTPMQARQDVEKELQLQGALAAKPYLSGGATGSPISGAISRLTGTMMQQSPLAAQQMVSRGLGGLGQIAGAFGATDAAEALRRGAMSPKEQQAEDVQKAAMGLASSEEGMMKFAERLRNMGRADLAMKMEEKATELNLKKSKSLAETATAQAKLTEAQTKVGRLELDRQTSTAETMLGLSSGTLANASASSVAAAMNALEAGKNKTEARQLIKDKQTGKTIVNIDQKQQGEFSKVLGEQQAKDYMKSQQQVDNLTKSMGNLETMGRLLDKGIFTGKAAELLLEGGRLLNMTGLTDSETVKNTETFIKTAARETLTIMSSGALGAGTGLSDADRKFAEGVALGDITLDEGSIRRLMSIAKRVNVNSVKLHNEKVAEYNERYPTAKLKPRNYVGQQARLADGTIVQYDGEGWVGINQ